MLQRDEAGLPFSHTRQLLDLRHDLCYLKLQPLRERESGKAMTECYSVRRDCMWKRLFLADWPSTKMCCTSICIMQRDAQIYGGRYAKKQRSQIMNVYCTCFNMSQSDLLEISSALNRKTNTRCITGFPTLQCSVCVIHTSISSSSSLFLRRMFDSSSLSSRDRSSGTERHDAENRAQLNFHPYTRCSPPTAGERAKMKESTSEL